MLSARDADPDPKPGRGAAGRGAARLAGAVGVPVLAIAGSVTASVPEGLAAISLSELFGAEASFSRTLDCVRLAAHGYLLDHYL